jgi:hypothetical protein
MTMPSIKDEGRGRGSLELVDSSVLETIVPFASEFDIEDALGSYVGDSEDSDGSAFAFIPQRKLLYFGTSVCTLEFWDYALLMSN